MASVNIRLKEINDVYKLVNVLVGFDGDVDLESGRYKVDGKSILGIFSLDLAKPIKMDIPEFYKNERTDQSGTRIQYTEKNTEKSRASEHTLSRSPSYLRNHGSRERH